MHGKIVVLDQPQGPLGALANTLRENGFHVLVCDNHEEVLKVVREEESQLLIALGIVGSGAALAEQLYDAVSIPIMLVLNTAGDETMTFLRRHPGVIGVYYTPINTEKFLVRVRRFFEQ